MESGLSTLQGYCVYPTPGCPVETLPPTKISARPNNQPSRPRQTKPKRLANAVREIDRSVSQPRRFFSTGRSRSRRRNKQVLVKQQPSGWYQADRVTRNLSLAPRLPTSEQSGVTYSVAGDQAQRKRRNKRNRRSLNKWHKHGRFPSPSVFQSTLGLLSELPCARLHYDSFRRIFPTLPTRTMKERKFRLEAAQQLPFAKYPDEQVRSILDISRTKTEPTVGDNSLYTWQTKDDTTKTNTQAVMQGGPEEGDTQMVNELSEVSNEPDEDETQDEDENEDKEECEGDEPRTDVALEVTRTTDITSTVNEHAENDENLASESQADSTTAVRKPSNMVSEEFLSVNETESKLNDGLGLTEPRRQIDEESLPFIDIGQETDVLDLAPLATYVEVPVQANATPQSSPMRREIASSRRLTTNNVDEQMRRNRGGRLSPKAARPQTSPSDPCKLTHKQREPTTTSGKVTNTPEETIPTPQAAVSLFESAAYNGHQTFGAFLCNVCGQTAYPAERCEADGQVFHVACFRCHQCSTMLQRGAWNQRGMHYFCNPCHRRIALQTLRH
ncbi:hypothetical protein CRM22_005366 [Opisthorchis felineus]|uniref:LIM zinc-binding domain-containing protein n=1 Tax=Opisthorchis felineus TaxID=147828 RepID=A0A4S2LSU2_OPIFE|nr:hypothetical protein CRM22_005366 [Opisthorchis felineus]